jgi:hypothetical protein
MLRFFKRSKEFLNIDQVDEVPKKLRGIYVLYNVQPGQKRRKVYDLRYIGMSATGIGSRLRSHKKSRRKKDKWTHFSIFEVWDNVTRAEITELEGLARHLYRYDSTASTLNIQRGFRQLSTLRKRSTSVGEWR